MKSDKNVRKSRRRRLWLVAAILFIAGIWLAARAISSPVHGREVKPEKLSVSRAAKSKADTQATDIVNNYFQLALPAGYRPQNASQPVPGLLFSQVLIKPSAMGSMIINISIKDLPEGGLNGDSGYRLREQQATRYSISSQTVSGDTVRIANDRESAAVVAFWEHGSYLATISVTSGISNPAADDNAEQATALKPLLQAWQWR